MSKFKQGKEKETPAVSTASLPDIVFMLLFFFMVTTVMREVDLKVEVSQPEATEIEKLEDRSLVKNIYIGTPYKVKTYGTEPRIQLNDDFADLKDIQPWVEAQRTAMPEVLQGKMIVSLKVDKEAKMGIITDVKQKLRKSMALKLNYSTLERVQRDK